MVLPTMLALLAIYICFRVAVDKTAPWEVVMVYWALVAFKYVFELFKLN